MNAQKSVAAAVILTVLFNFFGLLYSSRIAFLIIGLIWLAGIIFAGVFVGTTYSELSSENVSAAEQLGTDIGAGLGFFFYALIVSGVTWIASVAISVIATQKHNRNVARTAELAEEVRHQETLAALERQG